MNTRLMITMSMVLLGFVANSHATEKNTTPEQIVPVPLEKSYMEGKDLTPGDTSYFDVSYLIREGKAQKFSSHTYFDGKIKVAIYESEPGKVYINSLPFDEYVHILEGRLILTPEGGEPIEFKTGDSLIVPKGYVGTWDLPEKYREFIIINSPTAETKD